jgi:hypothetical protein
MDFEAGQTLGDYEILRVLGAGGMGKVYQVRNTLTNRVEALKVLLPDLTSASELVDRFLREIRISASLDHPNIAALRTAQRVNNQLLMVMEYVEGSTLDSMMHKARLPLGEAIDYTAQALSALAYAHSKGVIHRDIKPGNIMLTPMGMVKLMDFGIAKLASDRKLTKTGLMVGSVYYMSPEQIEGRDLDVRSDLYSLGITLYEIATGQRPFTGDSEYKIMAGHLKEAPQPPREIDPTLPQELNDIILIALAKDPAQRFQSAEAFRGALSSVGSTLAVNRIKIAPEPPSSLDFSPPAAVAPLPAPVKQDYRLAYMLVGSIVTILVIAAAIVEIPKYRHASAGSLPAAQASPVETRPAVTPALTPAPVHETAAAPTVVVGTPAAALPKSRLEAVQHPAAVVAGTAQVAVPAPAGQSPPVQSPPVQSIPVQSIPVQPAPVQPPPVQPQVPTTAPATDTAELSDLRDRMLQMSARVGAVTTSLQGLQRELARSGLSLRSDVVASQQRMNNQLGEAESSLSQSNAASAKKRLDAAERDLEKLENFLGK